MLLCEFGFNNIYLHLIMDYPRFPPNVIYSIFGMDLRCISYIIFGVTLKAVLVCNKLLLEFDSESLK